MKRRTFIRRVGSILTVLGVAEATWLTPKSLYYQALAQSNPRKLALLVGINQYPGNPSLSGCLTDVELQRQLLINRFGFESRNILTLTDDQASRQSIEDAFLEHFVNQVKVGDTVFFHFSGYGSRIKSENILVPVDGNVGNYILEDTLLLMLRSLPTNNVVATLDTSYNLLEEELPVSLVTRSLSLAAANPSRMTAEIEFQNQFSANSRTQQPILVIKAGNNHQPSAELQISGFSAGLFTYGLTQYLWESTPATTIQTSLQRIENSMQLLGSQQQPTLLSQNQQRLLPLISNYLPNNTTVSAEGAIIATEEDGKTWELWLGGIPINILEYYGVNSQFQVVTKDGNYVTDLIMRSRNGLIAKAQIINQSDTTLIQVGQLLRESIRILPRNISLTVALDPSLDRVERVDATSAFANIPRVSNVKAGEQPGDYILSKLFPAKREESPASSLISTATPYGLYTLGGELIPSTDGEAGEAVKIAVQRLIPKLQTLLAAKLWQLTDNQISSGLGVKVNLEMLNGVYPKVLMQRETQRIQSSETEKSTISIPIGSHIQYRIENKCDRTLYLMLLGLDSGKNPFILYPGQKSTDITPAILKNLTIAPGASIVLPQTAPGFDWVMQGLTNLWQTQLIFSTAPFSESITALTTTKLPATQQQRIIPLSNPCEVAQAILQDLHNANLENKETGDNYILNVKNWASLGFMFQVV
jgi:Caspase domain